ncbi:MAG: SPOR domain-containing protein [Syntrophales bacterium]
MKSEGNPEEQLVNELESIYKRVADEKIGENSFSRAGEITLFDSSSAEKAAGRDQFGGPSLPPRRKRKPLRNRLLALAGILFVAAALFALFAWPTLYYYKSIKHDRRIYLVKVNRLTGNMQYFYGGKWSSSVITEKATPQDYPASAKASPAVQANTGEKPRVAAAKSPAAEDAGKSTAAAVKLQDRPAPQIPAEEAGYAVQVRAFRSQDEVKAFMEANSDTHQFHWSKVRIPGRGVWYRVFIGHFALSNEASRYIKENGIEKSFPGCFVQKISRQERDRKKIQD